MITSSAETDAPLVIAGVTVVEEQSIAPTGRWLPPFDLLLSAPETHQRVWAFVDQGIVSFGNFVTTVLLARALNPGEFGVFALLFASILFMNTVHAALVTYPLAIFGAPMTDHDLRTWTTKAIAGTGVVGVAVAACMCVLCIAVGQPRLFLIVSMAMIFWQLQETTRTAFFAHLRQKHAVLGDAASYLGQAVLIAVLWNRGAVTLGRTFGVMALSSLVGFFVQAAQLKLSSFGLSDWRDFGRASRKLGTWGLPARMATFFTLQAFPWVLFYSHGPVAVGIYQALGSSVAAGNPIVFSTGNLITASVAREGGLKRFDRAFRHGLNGLAIVGVFYLVAIFNPHLILRVFYGAQSLYVQQAAVFRIMVLGCALQAVALMAGCVIGGLAETRKLFCMQVVGMATALLFALPFAAAYGVLAAAVGFLFVQASQALYGIRTCKQLFDGLRA